MNNKKIPFILLVFHKNKFAVDYKKKAELFNSFLGDSIPLSKMTVNYHKSFYLRLQSIFEMLLLLWTTLAKIIENLDPEKTHDHDVIGMRMLTLCSNSSFKAVKLIFKFCLLSVTFSLQWKKANVNPVHEKNYSHALKKYQPVSLHQAFSKIFECLFWNNLYNFFQ